MILPSPDEIFAAREVAHAAKVAELMRNIKSQMESNLATNSRTVYLVLPAIPPVVWGLLVKACKEDGWLLERTTDSRNTPTYTISWKGVIR